MRAHADLASALEHGRRRLADERDQALAAEIALGTLRWRAALDHAIAWAGSRAIGAFDADVLDILRLSAYQLLHLDRVPAAAVVNDGVGLTRQRGRDQRGRRGECDPAENQPGPIRGCRCPRRPTRSPISASRGRTRPGWWTGGSSGTGSTPHSSGCA